MDKEKLLHRLDYIRDEIREFGSALHAEDRGYESTAREIEARATKNIQNALTQSVELQNLLPNLWQMLEANQYIANSDYQIIDEIAAARKQLGGDPV